MTDKARRRRVTPIKAPSSRRRPGTPRDAPPRDDRPRRRTFNIANPAHELTFSCYHRFPFLKAERSCLWPADALRDARRSRAFALWAYVFMPDHVHLVIHPNDPEYAIASILHAIKRPVARAAVLHLEREAPAWLDRISARRGDRIERHFWQPGGGYDRNLDEPRTLARMIAYLHENPGRRGLVPRAIDWRWSSAAWFEEAGSNGLDPDPIPPEWWPEERA